MDRAERWEQWLRDLAAFRREHGHARVPWDYETAQGRRLGAWVTTCRAEYRRGRLPAERIADLTAVGVDLGRKVVWPGWEGWLELLAAYRDEHGHVGVPTTYVTPEGRWLGAWVFKRRREFWSGALSAAQADTLREFGVELEKRSGRGPAHKPKEPTPQWMPKLDAPPGHLPEN